MGSVSDPDSPTPYQNLGFWWIRIKILGFWWPKNNHVSDPYPDPLGSGSRKAKMTHKNRKKYRIFMFWSAGCSLLRAEGFSRSLGVLYGGLGISKWQFLNKKIKLNFQLYILFNFRSSNSGSGSAIRKNTGSVSGSALNQCRSETLQKFTNFLCKKN